MHSRELRLTVLSLGNSALTSGQGRILQWSMKANATYFCLLGIAAAICVVFVLPFLIDTGHTLLCIPLFAFLAVLAIYGRCNPMPVRRKKSAE